MTDRALALVLLEAFHAMVIVTKRGQPCYNSGNGVPMEMPRAVERKIRLVLKLITLPPRATAGG